MERGEENLFIKKASIEESTKTDKTIAPIDEKNERRHLDHALIKDKINICRGVVTEKLGAPNVYETARYLYTSLYHPEQGDEIVPPSDRFPDRVFAFKKSLSMLPVEIPTEEKFIEKMRHAMTKGVDFSECISENAKNQLQQVMEKSEHTVIWTDGDGIGAPDQKLPGSKEQIKKLASAQIFNKLRKDIAQERGVDHKDVLSVVAQEGKMKFIPEIIERFLEKGISRIVIVEDRMKNLVNAIDIISKEYPQIEIFPVWIRIDEREKNKFNPEKTLEEWAEELHAIDDISNLMSLLRENNVFEGDVKVGSILDFDGPLNDDYKRKDLQIEIAIKTLEENNWI